MMRKAEALRDKIMLGVGTDEPFATEQGNWAMHWRKPLRVDEAARMKPTQEVRERPGRP
jgi:hypothetical protein